MDMIKTEGSKRAILSLEGANCTSCAIAIEHFGRRMDEVEDIFVDRATSTIQLVYDGTPAVLERLCKFVDQLGYQARIKSTG